MSDDGFFRNLSGLATDWVRSKRKALQSEPQTKVDSSGGGHRYSFGGQNLTFGDLREIKDIRDSGGTVAQLMEHKALLNFGGGAEIHVEDDEETQAVVDGEPMTLSEWLEAQFPRLDLLVLDLGSDALWFPYAVGELQETQAGGFKRALPAEPWTLLPKTDARGQIQAWEQRTKQPAGGHSEQTLPADDLWHIVVNKSSARDETGISEILRNEDEIQAYKQNEQAINKAIELHGFPQRHVKVGRDEGAPVSDDDLRRVRTIFDPRTTESNTAYFTGQDVDVETLEAHNFDYTAIHEMDMRNLTTALGLPLEAGNVGSDGLGSGKPAELRFSMLKLSIKANQRRFGTQFVERILRPVVRRYSPFDHNATITLDIADPLEDIGEVADLIQQVGDYMTNAEARRKLDLPEPEDDDVADSYRTPADMEAAEEGDGQPDLGGLFNGNRELEAIADIDMGDYPDAAVENAKMALKARDETGNPNDCGTRVGWERANQLANGEDLSEDTIERMASFARHEDNKEQGEEGRADCGWMMWKAWGGDEGIEWAERKSEQIDQARQNAALSDEGRGTGNSHCHGVSEKTLVYADDWERSLIEMQQAVTHPDTPTERALVSFASSGTPEFVLDRIREAVDDGAMFSQFDDIPSDRLMELRSQFKESLGTDNFTLDSITDSLMEFEADLSRNEAERIARTESSAVLNRARELGYEDRGESDELFYWTGADPGDDRQTEACEWLIRQTNPFHGGTPVPMDELREMVDEAPKHDDDMDNALARPDSWVVHPNERSTFAKAPLGDVA